MGGGELRLQAGVAAGKALTGGWQRVVVQTGGLLRFQPGRHGVQLRLAEVLFEYAAATVGGAARQPVLAEAVAVDAQFGSKTGRSVMIFSTSVLPSEVTASPVVLAPVAIKAAMLSVVPAMISQLSGRPSSAAALALIWAKRLPGLMTSGSTCLATPN